jgi:hypothetical protein
MAYEADIESLFVRRFIYIKVMFESPYIKYIEETTNVSHQATFCDIPDEKVIH